MAKVIITINDETMSHLSDETREMFFDTLRYMALEAYGNASGTDPDMDEMDIESYEVDMKVVAYIETGETFDDDNVNELETTSFFVDENEDVEDDDFFEEFDEEDNWR